jgi:muramoyltetrapeptide carboxypeptidase
VQQLKQHAFDAERVLIDILHHQNAGGAPNDYDVGYDLPQVFDYLRQQLSVPLISGLEFG